MRDILTEAVGSNPDPVRVASQSARSQLPKKFYDRAEMAHADGMLELRLDGRPARTPGRLPVRTRSARVGEAIANEWNAQTDRIDPISMPITRTLNSAIDGVAPRMAEVRADVVAFAGSDLLCYRATEPDRLVRRQAEAWDPVLDRFHEAGARFETTRGVMPIVQSPEVLARIDEMVSRDDDPLVLAALHVATTITGSALLALAVRARWIGVQDAWAAAHVDEDWNRELWGEDEDATRTRAARQRDYEAAAFILGD